MAVDQETYLQACRERDAAQERCTELRRELADMWKPGPEPEFPPPPAWEVQNKADRAQERLDQDRLLNAMETIATSLERIAQLYDRAS